MTPYSYSLYLWFQFDYSKGRGFLLDIENLEPKHKVKLSVPLIASYLKRGISRTKIAEICNVSHQAVYNYCDRHYDELAPLIDTTDSLFALQSKHIARKAQERLLLHLKDTEKKDLFALNAISGTHVDKYRLLSDKSTANVSIDAVRTDLKEVEARLKELKARRKQVTGDLEMGNQESIEAESGEEGIK